VVVHAVLFLFALVLFNIDVSSPRSATEIISNIQRVTLTLPSDLTQKEPNKTKVSKEVNVEDLKPRPASQQRLPPAPAARMFRPPVERKAENPKPGLPNEPPKLDANLTPPPSLPPPAAGTPQAQAPPPQIQPEEKPKLALETPGQAATGTQYNPARGAGQIVGDIDQPPNLPESMRLPPVDGRPGSSLELLSDPMGVDFKPYLAKILAVVRRNWFAIIPESAKLGNTEVVLLQFIIDRTGQVPKLVIAMPSGNETRNRAAVASISASVPFPPLPADFKGREVRLQFAFKYSLK
jgi:TonB family protein